VLAFGGGTGLSYAGGLIDEFTVVVADTAEHAGRVVHIRFTSSIAFSSIDQHRARMLE
jgi:hypothetical protein